MSRMTLFLSYNEADDASGTNTAGALREELAHRGIDAKMAGRDIQPGTRWEDGIRRLLEASSALLCVATVGFSGRRWCQQEIGWAVGRGIPTLWIKYSPSEPPDGFLASTQALTPPDPDDHGGIADLVLDWLANDERTRPLVTEALLDLLEQSQSFSDASQAAHWMVRLRTLSQDQWDRLESIIATNSQVGNAHVRLPARYPRRPWPSVDEWLHKKLGVLESNEE